MYPSLDDVGYLARSPSRVRVLEALEEAPRERRELTALTDVSRVTLSRTLANLEDRGWIEQRNGRYDVTEPGAFIAREFTQLLANVDTLQALDAAVAWLPIERFGFDLACLSDAKVTTSSWTDHTASIRRVADIVRGSQRVLGTASGVSREVVEALHENALHGDGTVQLVLDRTALEIVRSEAALRSQLKEMVEAGAEVARFDGDEPLLMVTVCDGTVLLCGHDKDGPPTGTLETTNEDVLAWAISYFDNVHPAGAPLEADVFRP